MKIPRPTARCCRPGRRGSAIIEFALVVTFMFLPILAGAGTVGVSLITAMQVANLNANAGQMFSSGVDFTQATNVAIMTNLAGNLNNTTGSGYVVVLSEIDVTTSGAVLAQQVVLGNAALSGNVSDINSPATQVGSGILALPGALAAQTGQPPQAYTAYVAETYFDNSPYAWFFAAAGTGTGIYVKNVF